VLESELMVSVAMLVFRLRFSAYVVCKSWPPWNRTEKLLILHTKTVLCV
jgi:hypothetical protein